MAVHAKSTTLIGIEAVQVEVETQIISALRRFVIVGLPDGVVREAKDRVRCAIQNSGLGFPEGEVIVSLAPASLPKFGARFDLAIALTILAADGQLDRRALSRRLFLGELSLDGRLKPVPGELASAMELKRTGGGQLLVPDENAVFAAGLEDIDVVGVSSLLEAVAYLQNRIPRKEITLRRPASVRSKALLGFGDVVGQHAAKRALEVAAAGGHNLMMVGPPGAGKSMLAKRVPAILPPLSKREALEVRKIYSAGGCLTLPGRVLTLSDRPFRAPHHTISSAGLVGGGSNPLPGEISLAHHGLLFLDEFTELRRDVLESLREPLENQRISISRAKLRVSFPADFMLIAAMNPCPCGKRGAAAGEVRPSERCSCTPAMLQRYQAKLSGPIVDRIDLHIWVPPVPVRDLAAPLGEDPTTGMRERVLRAREIQERRLGGAGKLNARMSPEELKRHCNPDSTVTDLLEKAADRFGLSARAYTRLLKVSRTIADLDGSEAIAPPHVMEAMGYRQVNLGEW